MDTLMKANVFFFVTTIAVIALSIAGIIASVYVIRILRSIQRAADKLEKDLSTIGEDMDTLYHKVSQSFVFNLLFRKRKKK